LQTAAGTSGVSAASKTYAEQPAKTMRENLIRRFALRTTVNMLGHREWFSYSPKPGTLPLSLGDSRRKNSNIDLQIVGPSFGIAIARGLAHSLSCEACCHLTRLIREWLRHCPVSSYLVISRAKRRRWPCSVKHVLLRDDSPLDFRWSFRCRFAHSPPLPTFW
jgi:hypothetical protein